MLYQIRIAPLLISGLIAATGFAHAETAESIAASAGARFAAPSVALKTAAVSGTTAWTKLLHKVGEGEFSRPFGNENPIGTFGLADIRPNVSRDSGTPHKADYINLWGGISDDNQFSPAYVTLVSEDWQALKNQSSKPEVTEGCKQTKCFYIDQWLFTLELDGSLRRQLDRYAFSHLFVIENADGRVFDNGAVEPASTDDQGKSKLAGLVTQWETFTSK